MTDLERVTVNLTPKASKALWAASDLTGDSKTDTINRALQIYAYLEGVIAGGGKVIVQPHGEDAQMLKIF